MKNVRLSISRGLRRLADRIHPEPRTTWTTSCSPGMTITIPSATATNTTWSA